MKSLFAYTASLFAAATLSAAVVNGGGTGTTTPTTPVVTPTKPTTGTCQKPATQPAIKPIELKCVKKEAPKPAPIKSAAPACSKK